MTQSARPISFASNPDGWVTQAGVTTNLHESIDDATTDATDFIATEGLPPITDTAEYPIPLIDAGGLYGNGQNDPPTAHLNAGLTAAGQVPAVGAVFTALGMSTTATSWVRWRDLVAVTDSDMTDPPLAAGGQTVDDWDEPTDTGWARLTTLANQGYPAADIVVVWMLLVKGTAAEPSSPTVQDMEEVLIQIKDLLPNCKQVFVSSYPYGGYSANEPDFWDSGIVMRQFILNHLGEQNPWLGWGPYLWANGTTPRSDGLTWEVEDYATDGVHPSEIGYLKIADMLEAFFQFSTLTPWYRP